MSTNHWPTEHLPLLNKGRRKYIAATQQKEEGKKHLTQLKRDTTKAQQGKKGHNSRNLLTHRNKNK